MGLVAFSLKTIFTREITNEISIKIADRKFVSVFFLSASSDAKLNGHKNICGNGVGLQIMSPNSCF